MIILCKYYIFHILFVLNCMIAMKNLFYWFFVIVLFVGMGSCTNDVEKIAVTKFSKDEVANKLYRRKFYVDQAFKTQGDQTVDLMKDSIVNIFRNAVYIEFFNLFNDQSTVYWCNGNPSMDSNFPPPARTFVINRKIELPTAMKVTWDDGKSTMAIESGDSQYFPILSPGKKAYLESINLYNTEEEAKNAAIPESVVFKAYDTHSTLGEVTYTVVLKRLWLYDGNDLSHWKYVIYK